MSCGFEQLKQLVLCLFQVFAGAHAANEVGRLRVLMTIDLHEGLPSDPVCKDLAQSGLAAACITDEQNWLTILQTLLDKDCETFQLLACYDLR